VNFILAGKAPVSPDLLDCTGIALAKGEHDVRPIAMGEAWLKLASLAALTECSQAAEDLLPLQFAAGIAGGAQNVGHTLNAHLRKPGAITAAADLANAFNSLSRQAVMDAVADRLPALLPFVAYVYGNKSHIHLQGAPADTPPVPSTTGVRQGDPLAMFLFCLTLQAPLARVQARHPTCRLIAYADDIHVQGPPDAVLAAIPDLQHECGSVSLTMVPTKGAVYSHTDATSARDTAAQLDMPHAAHGMVAVGTPLGGTSYVRGIIQAKADEARRCAAALMDLDLTPQIQYALLTRCIQRKLDHFLRTVPWEHWADIYDDFSAGIARHVLCCCDLSPTLVDESPQIRAQLSLPLREGGFGVTHQTKASAEAAWLSAAAMTDLALETGPTRYLLFLRQPESSTSRKFLRRFLGQFPTIWPELETACPRDAQMTPEFLRNHVVRAQTLITRHLGKQRGLVFQSEGDRKHKARMLSLQNRPAAAFFDTLPISPETTISTTAFHGVAKTRLGLTSAWNDPPPVTCGCGAHLSGNDADHAQTCSQASLARIWRHDVIKGAVSRIAHRAGLASHQEGRLRGYGSRAPPRPSRSSRRGSGSRDTRQPAQPPLSPGGFVSFDGFAGRRRGCSEARCREDHQISQRWLQRFSLCAIFG